MWMQYLWNIHCSLSAQRFIPSHLFAHFHEMLLISEKYGAYGNPSFPWWLLPSRCSMATSRASSVSHSQVLCQGVIPQSGSTFGMTVLPLIQCLCGDSSCPRWQWAAASGTEPVDGGTANPPGAYCGTRFIGCCQGITSRRRVRIRCVVYLLVKGQTAWELSSFLVKGSICLVQSEIHTQRERKSEWLQRHDLDGAGTRMIRVFFDGALDALRGEQISSLDHRHIYGRLTLSRLPLKPTEK